MTGAVEGLLDAMTREKPGSQAADKARWQLERALMEVLRAGGRRAVQALVRDLKARGRRIKIRPGLAGVQEWHEPLESGREWTLYARSSHGIRALHVQYKDAPPPLTPRQQKKHDTQDAFYALYNRIAERAYASSPEPKLKADDRVVLLVAELEADVNNGGFDQYLFNKGRRRARSALAALERIGAKRTAAMLASALEHSSSREHLDKLDDRFYRRPEDLALLAMKYLG